MVKMVWLSPKLNKNLWVFVYVWFVNIYQVSIKQILNPCIILQPSAFSTPFSLNRQKTVNAELTSLLFFFSFLLFSELFFFWCTFTNICRQIIFRSSLYANKEKRNGNLFCKAESEYRMYEMWDATVPKKHIPMVTNVIIVR